MAQRRSSALPRTEVTLPAGVGRVYVTAAGGHGGGLTGGSGAIVTGTLQVASAAGRRTRLLIEVGGNGGIGVAGSNGGSGTAAAPSLAGGGGGWSGVTVCRSFANDRCLSQPTLLAGGGGGGGADFLPGLGGAGGAAGAAGSPGSATAGLPASAGGPVGAPRVGGAGSAPTDPSCAPGTAGGSFGRGGESAALDGRGDGGGGGGGTRGGQGAGGGGGGTCADGSGSSGAGGAGGNSLVPRGGQQSLDASGQPSVMITYEIEQPVISIAVPAEGATYAQGSRVRASFACSPSPEYFRVRITSCVGSTGNRQAIDTRSLGEHSFAVTAGDSVGIRVTRTISYRVADLTAPRIARLRVAPGSVDATVRGAYMTVSFRLTEPARVRVGIHRVRSRAGNASRRHARVIVADAGRNSFRLRPRIGGRALEPGAYRLTLTATDTSGNRSRAGRRFVVSG